ncbi:hypothetical protein OG943_07085 [Amycolatopsis sp. NBC_00345]
MTSQYYGSRIRHAVSATAAESAMRSVPAPPIEFFDLTGIRLDPLD